ncbi:MAG: toxin-antitoxin system HicB family antitoxin [Dehalococcoidia bacterium]|nr:toxin-antitoxin system HicB family antitoxin [Dehalococcoidia bacterium]
MTDENIRPEREKKMDKNDLLEKQLDDYTNLPYTVSVEPQDDGKGIYYVARVVELPDLFMTGATREEAVRELEAVKQDWMTEYIKLGNKMPLPLKLRKYSGKIIVRMPPSLHETLVKMAELESVSFNQYMVTALARCAGRDEATKTTGTY